jgi:hypothetical protein
MFLKIKVRSEMTNLPLTYNVSIISFIITQDGCTSCKKMMYAYFVQL